jgi:hypothetical protein
MLAQGRYDRPRRTVIAAASQFVHHELGGHAGPARVLGAFPTACYLQLASAAVIALVTADAVRLPIGVLLPFASQDLPLDELDLDSIAVQPNRIELGSLTVNVQPSRQVALNYLGRPAATALGHAQGRLSRHPAYPEVRAMAKLPVSQLIGRGPGLTPAGDDLLCGVLAGARMFGRPLSRLTREIEQQLQDRPRATTSLSRALLLRALAGEGLPELSTFGRALIDGAGLPRAVTDLATIGHSSGVALAVGTLVAAERTITMAENVA